jgi:hypothetical protein
MGNGWGEQNLLETKEILKSKKILEHRSEDLVLFVRLMTFIE